MIKFMGLNQSYELHKWKSDVENLRGLFNVLK